MRYPRYRRWTWVGVAVVSLGWTAAWVGIGMAYYQGRNPPNEMQVEYYHVPLASCDTDTDCMNKFGGDGGPAPKICCSEAKEGCSKCVAL